MRNEFKFLLKASIATIALAGTSSLTAQIPPDSQIISKAASGPPVWHHDDFSGSTLELIAPANYSPNNPNVQLRATFLFNTAPPPPPYDDEYVELDFDGGPAFQININTECTRSADRLSLICNFVRQIPASDAAKDFVSARARYYAWDANTPYYTQQSSSYTQHQAFSANYATKTLYCDGYANGTACVTSGGGNQSPLCNGESTPIMPASISTNGAFIFEFDQSDVCPTEFWIDPPIANQYDYSITGSTFTSVTMPSLSSVADTDGYFVQFPGQGIPAVVLQAGQSHNFAQPVTAFQITGIDSSLQLDAADPMAFPLGVEVVPPTGPMTITQTPSQSPGAPPPPPPPPPPAPWLIGTNVSLTAMNNSNNLITQTVSNAVEFEGANSYPRTSNTNHRRFNVDVQRDTVRVTFVHPHGLASYGNGMMLNLVGLKPNIRNCNSPGVVTSATATTSKSDAPYTISGTRYAADRVDIALAPPAGVYNWSKSDWIEIKLTFGCPPPPPPLAPGAPPQSPNAAPSPPISAPASREKQGYERLRDIVDRRTRQRQDD